MGGWVAFLVAGGHVCGVFRGILAPLEAQKACAVAWLASVEVEQARSAVLGSWLVVVAVDHETSPVSAPPLPS